MESGFRLSSYLTLALATLCLGYAETVFLPGIAIFVLPMLVLLAVAFFAEGRWCLPIWASNLLGLGIAAASGGWITFRILRPGASPTEGIPFPVMLLPYLGPFLTILLVAKLFRPKRAADLWVLQGMGLLQVALGCVLANDFLFGLLLFAYLACGLWFLALFHAQREQAGGPALAALSRRGGLAQVGRWTLAVTAAGGLLFLLIPRFGATQWHLLGQLAGAPADHQPAQVGHSELIDLHRTGPLKVTDEIALTVTVTDARGRPKRDLSPRQRWRGVVLDRYHDGRWVSVNAVNRPNPFESPSARWADSLSLSTELPNLGERQFFVDFSLDPQGVGGLLLAEPVILHPGKPEVPVAPQPGDKPWPRARFLETDWTLFQPFFRSAPEIHYRQVVVPLEEPDLSLPVRVSDSYLPLLLGQCGYSLKEWTDQLLRGLAARSAHGLSAADLQYTDLGQSRFLKLDHHEKVARALCEYLATSGDYTYTLNLRSHDRKLDPVEDFLRHVKQGHCERFAAGLTMMLRAQGIPARIVKGFQGGTHLGNGEYEIKQSDAHSWVEALVPRQQPDGSVELHWLTLDPTTSIETPPPPRFTPSWWMESGKQLGQAAWREFVVEYDVEQQSGLWAAWRPLIVQREWRPLLAWVVRAAPWLALVPAALAGVWLLRRFRRRLGSRAAARGPEVAFYARLLAILDRRCRLRPGPAQTPREFSAAARQVLEAVPNAVPLAGLPARIADLFYRVRYGRQALGADEEQDLNGQLERLDAALRPS
jgi:transglutaminase-like putative cysteine protease